MLHCLALFLVIYLRWKRCKKTFSPFRRGLVLTFEKTEVKCLDLFSGPRRTPKEFQAGFDARFIVEALDVDLLPQRLPAVLFDQLGEDGFQRQAVKGVVGLSHGFVIFYK